jgi:hypothetical protein
LGTREQIKEQYHKVAIYFVFTADGDEKAI